LGAVSIERSDLKVRYDVFGFYGVCEFRAHVLFSFFVRFFFILRLSSFHPFFPHFPPSFPSYIFVFVRSFSSYLSFRCCCASCAPFSLYRFIHLFKVINSLIIPMADNISPRSNPNPLRPTNPPNFNTITLLLVLCLLPRTRHP
jgi:hypothetical protein